MRLSRALVAAVVTVAAAAPVLAQQPCACPPAPPAPPKPPYEFSADFSLAQASGNQDVLTTALGEKFVYKWPRWKFTQSANVAYGRANGVTNAQLYTLGLRTDYALRPNLALFARIDALSNEPAGLRSVLNEAVGLSWTVLKTDRDELRLDAGVGALQRSFVRVAGVAQPSESDLVGNLDGFYRRKWGDKAYFEQSVNFVPNFTTTSGWLATAKSSLVAPITSKLGLRLGYLATYNNAPSLLPILLPNRPVPVRAKKFDGLFTAGLQFTM